MKAEYVDHMGNDLAVVNAARVSFDKTSTLEEVITSKPRYPAKWEVGMEVEYVRDTDEWGPQAGERGKIVRLSGDCATRRADLYQVFWVKVGSGTFWTTPDQVKLVGSTEFPKVERRLREADAKLIDYLAKHEHWTPFAHTSITLRMQAPVPIRTQCFKHKFGFVENEESRRYISGSPWLFYPKVWRKAADKVKQGSSEERCDTKIDWVFYGNEYESNNVNADEIYNDATGYAVYAYETLIKMGVCPEQARFVLPQGIEVQWIWTGSLAAYARFYRQRTDPHAQKETQELARMVGEIIEPLFPVSWKALTHAG